jgi:hypothetical protein
MAEHVQGKFFILKAWKEDNFYPFACCQELRLNVETEQIPATSVDSGSFRRFKPGISSWGVSGAGVLYIDYDSTRWFSYDLMIEQFRQNGIDIVITADDGTNTRTTAGHVNIVRVEHSKISGQAAKFSFEFIGDGPLSIDYTIPTPTGTEVTTYLYEATGGEDSFIHADAINRTILGVFTAGEWYDVITSGTPAGLQVLYDTDTGEFTFPFNLATDQRVFIEYR